jgi:SRSO17 transposase
VAGTVSSRSDGTAFATKPGLTVKMIERTIAAGVPFAWVAADSVYGVGDIERVLRRAGKGYVLGVNANHHFGSW